jgi:hypothetical protein
MRYFGPQANFNPDEPERKRQGKFLKNAPAANAPHPNGAWENSDDRI